MLPHDIVAPSMNELAERLTLAGFEVARAEGRLGVKRGPCAAVVVVEEAADGALRYSEGPGYLLGGAIAHLEDHGYQKFLVGGSARRPARAEQLRAIHDFSEHLNAALGVPTLYNQSLGTVSSRYRYDRLRGRP